MANAHAPSGGPHTYAVAGGAGGTPVPGALGPAELDGRAEWVAVRPRAGLLEALSARLGSEVDLRKVVLALLCPLRRTLEGPPLEAVLSRLPLPLAREVREGDRNLGGPVRSAHGAGDYLVEVARLLQHPPAHAAAYIRAGLAALRAALAPPDAEAVAARLSPDLRSQWAGAR